MGIHLWIWGKNGSKNYLRQNLGYIIYFDCRLNCQSNDVVSILAQFNHLLRGPENSRKWVFLHGLMGFANNWQKVIYYLEDTERCLSYDQRGHGRSIKPATGYSSEDYAADLKKILDELNWQKIILVGHSMGGRNALTFTATYPERVEKFILEDIGPQGDPDNYKYYEYLLNLVPTPFKSRAAAKDFFQNTFKKTAQTRDNVDMIAAYFYTNLHEIEGGHLDWRFDRNAVIESAKEASRNRWPEVKALKVPTLLIRGENSRELSKETYERMLAENPLIQGVEIAKAGHWVHADQPLLFVEALKNFVFA